MFKRLRYSEQDILQEYNDNGSDWHSLESDYRRQAFAKSKLIKLEELDGIEEHMDRRKRTSCCWKPVC